jgi:broad specificity phosphatase PhoE
MTRLLVVRHGETDWNAAGLMQGRADRQLNEAGRKHVRSHQLPTGWAGAVCLASPLQRAMETARLLGLEPKPEPRLIEMDWGEWEGQSLKALRAQLGEAMAQSEARGLDFRPPGGESPRDVQARLRPLLAGLTAATIAVTHKGVLRALYSLATGWTMQANAPDRLRNDYAHLFEAGADGTASVVELNIPLRRT